MFVEVVRKKFVRKAEKQADETTCFALRSANGACQCQLDGVESAVRGNVLQTKKITLWCARMSSKVESLIQEFVANLRQAIADDAAEMFRLAAGGAAPRKPGPKPKAATNASTLKSSTPKRKGGKRTSEEIEAQAGTILSYLKKNPQHGAEQIGAALGMTTSELALPIRSLLAKKSLKTVGQKRGTKYSVK